MSGYWNTLTSSCLGISSFAFISQKTLFGLGCIPGLASSLEVLLLPGSGYEAVQHCHSSERPNYIDSKMWVCAKSSSLFGMEEVWGMGHCQNNSSLCSILLVLQSSSTEFAPGLWNLMATKAVCPLVAPSRFHSLWPPQLLAAMPCQADCYLPRDSSILAWSWIQHFLKLHRLPKFLADDLIALHPLQALKIKRCCSMSTEPFFLPLPCSI